jgi:hypothetical protein
VGGELLELSRYEDGTELVAHAVEIDDVAFY